MDEQQRQRTLEQFMGGVDLILKGEQPGLDYEMYHDQLAACLPEFPVKQREDIRKVMDSANLQHLYLKAKENYEELKIGCEARETDMAIFLAKYVKS